MRSSEPKLWIHSDSWIDRCESLIKSACFPLHQLYNFAVITEANSTSDDDAMNESKSNECLEIPVPNARIRTESIPLAIRYKQTAVSSVRVC